MDESVFVLNHPLIQHKLGMLRNKLTNGEMFRYLLEDISILIGYEALRDIDNYRESIQTPLGVETQVPIIRGEQVVFISIMRSGNGMLPGLLSLLPAARVGHIGLYREPQTLTAIEYYFKVPGDMEQKTVFIADPILATGHSAVAAINRIKEQKPKNVVFINLVASSKGIEFVQEHHPDVKIFTASIDHGLNEQNFLVPGLGDAGDRMYGTT